MQGTCLVSETNVGPWSNVRFVAFAFTWTPALSTTKLLGGAMPNCTRAADSSPSLSQTLRLQLWPMLTFHLILEAGVLLRTHHLFTFAFILYFARLCDAGLINVAGVSITVYLSQTVQCEWVAAEAIVRSRMISLSQI